MIEILNSLPDPVVFIMATIFICGGVIAWMISTEVHMDRERPLVIMAVTFGVLGAVALAYGMFRDEPAKPDNKVSPEEIEWRALDRKYDEVNAVLRCDVAKAEISKTPSRSYEELMATDVTKLDSRDLRAYKNDVLLYMQLDMVRRACEDKEKLTKGAK